MIPQVSSFGDLLLLPALTLDKIQAVFVVVASFRRSRRPGLTTIESSGIILLWDLQLHYNNSDSSSALQNSIFQKPRHTSLVRERAVPRCHAQPVVVVVVYVKTEKIIVKLVHMIAIASSSSPVVVVVNQNNKQNLLCVASSSSSSASSSMSTHVVAFTIMGIYASTTLHKVDKAYLMSTQIVLPMSF